MGSKYRAYLWIFISFLVTGVASGWWNAVLIALVLITLANKDSSFTL